MVAQAGRPLVHARFLDLADHLRARRPAGRQRLRDAPRGAARATARTGRIDLHLSTPDPDEPRSGGSWSCAATAAACATARRPKR